MSTIEQFRSALGGTSGPGHPAFPSQAEADAAGEDFLRAYPPAGYGSRYRTRPRADGQVELIVERYGSCD